MLPTCPVIPNFHSAHGEYLEDKGLNFEVNDEKSTTKTHITKKSKSYLTRIDSY